MWRTKGSVQRHLFLFPFKKAASVSEARYSPITAASSAVLVKTRLIPQRLRWHLRSSKSGKDITALAQVATLILLLISILLRHLSVLSRCLYSTPELMLRCRWLLFSTSKIHPHPSCDEQGLSSATVLVVPAALAVQIRLCCNSIMGGHGILLWDWNPWLQHAESYLAHLKMSGWMAMRFAN